MEAGKDIGAFIEIISEDPRIGPAHISLFIALLYLSERRGNPVSVYGAELRRLAKINSKNSYYRIIRDLKAGNFIQVRPSYNPAIRSEIFLRKLDSE